MLGSALRWRTADLYSCGRRRPQTGRAARLDRTEACPAPIPVIQLPRPAPPKRSFPYAPWLAGMGGIAPIGSVRRGAASRSDCLGDGGRFLLAPGSPCGHGGLALIRTHRTVQALD